MLDDLPELLYILADLSDVRPVWRERRRPSVGVGQDTSQMDFPSDPLVENFILENWPKAILNCDELDIRAV
jgi:hypothetical protein